MLESEDCFISISMTSSRDVRNRLTVSDLPSISTIKDQDLLLVQSDGVSSNIQVKNLRWDRENVSFYNEIADLNKLTADNQLAIDDLRQKIYGDDPQADDQALNSSRLDKLVDDVDHITDKMNNIDAQVKNITASVASDKSATNIKLDQLTGEMSKLTTQIGGQADNLAKEYTEFVSGISIRMDTVESLLRLNSTKTLSSRLDNIETTLNSIKTSVSNLG